MNIFIHSYDNPDNSDNPDNVVFIYGIWCVCVYVCVYKERLIVSDRGNSRIEVVTLDGVNERSSSTHGISLSLSLSLSLALYIYIYVRILTRRPWYLFCVYCVEQTEQYSHL